MRVGFNPHKDKPHENSDYLHQIILPVYIPNQESYFKDSFAILKLCLESIFITIHNKTFITIVNNGSCQEITDYLNQLHKQNSVQEIIHTTNIGKINAVLKGIAGNNFSIITISDADVLFLNNWQKATYAVFEAFPKAGAICPTPSSRSLRTHTANIYWDLFFSNKLKFREVINPEGLKRFAQSVGNSDFYNKVQLQKQLTVENNNTTAVIGAGHFVTTYRSTVFNNLKNNFTNYKLGGTSESQFLDIPVVTKGFWRLSTADNYTYHLGNVLEDWMQVEINNLVKNQTENSFELKKIKSSSSISSFLKNKVFAKFILNKKIMKHFLIWKGLSKPEAENYLV